MRKLILFLVILAIVAGVVYVAVYERDRAMSLFKEGVKEAENLAVPKKPEDTLVRFRDAIKARDYETAATLLSGDYAEEMKRAAPGARRLGLSIDQLEGGVPRPELLSDQVKFILRGMEPFPPYLVWDDVVKEGDDRARTTIKELSNLPPQVALTFGVVKVDPLVPRALVRDWPSTGEKKVELRRDGNDWKLHISSTPELKKGVDRLIEKHEGYAKAIDSVKKQMLENKYPRAVDLEMALKRHLEAVR